MKVVCELLVRAEAQVLPVRLANALLPAAAAYFGQVAKSPDAGAFLCKRATDKAAAQKQASFKMLVD